MRSLRQGASAMLVGQKATIGALLVWRASGFETLPESRRRGLQSLPTFVCRSRNQSRIQDQCGRRPCDYWVAAVQVGE